MLRLHFYTQQCADPFVSKLDLERDLIHEEISMEELER